MSKSKTIYWSPDKTAVNRHMHQLGWSPYACSRGKKYISKHIQTNFEKKNKNLLSIRLISPRSPHLPIAPQETGSKWAARTTTRYESCSFREILQTPEDL